MSIPSTRKIYIKWQELDADGKVLFHYVAEAATVELAKYALDGIERNANKIRRDDKMLGAFMRELGLLK